MTRPAAPTSGSASRWRSPRRRRSGSPVRSPAACSTPAGRPARSCWPASRSPRSSSRRSPPARCAAAGARCAANAGLVLLFGAVPVAGTQFAYFSAVQRMDVGPALLIEYTAPAAVVVWLWLRHGERPGPLTVAGAGLAALGLVLVLDLLSGADLAPAGVLWALIAMTGAASYFVLGANPRPDLPPVALAGAGLATGALVLAALGAVGILPMARDDRLAGLRGQRRRLVAPAARARRRHRRPRLLHRASPPAAGSARAWPRSSRCSRSSPACVRVAAARPAPGPAPARRRRADRRRASSSSSSASARAPRGAAVRAWSRRCCPSARRGT